MEKKLPEEQVRFFEEKRKELEAKFVTPAYREFKICYVKDEKEADVKVSKHHIITDYLAVGFACLKKISDGCTDTEVKVYNADNYMSLEHAIFLNSVCPNDLGGINLFPNALYEVMFDIEKVMRHYFFEERVSLFGTGTILYGMVTSHLMEYDTMPEGQKFLEFSHFDDTLSAQENAFELAKLNIVTSVLGAIASLYED